MSQLQPTIYYLPGANGRLETGLGEGLVARGFKVTGRATIGEFKRLEFQAQLDVIAEDLMTKFWAPNARVVANSYGAYLFLHTQAQLKPYIGQVLLLSPILGSFDNIQRGQTFFPPRSDRLLTLARGGAYPAPLNMEIHTGSEDWQSPPEVAEEFGSQVGCQVHIATGRGHILGKDYVGPVLDQWLGKS
jgi:hypothetical protein